MKKRGSFVKSRFSRGFTLIELLVVTAILGVLAIVSANAVSNILRSQNKTTVINEINENGDLVAGKLERDVKFSTSVANPSITELTLAQSNGTTIKWQCVVGGNIERDDGTGFRSVTSTDTKTGVQAASCEFSTTLPSIPTLVTFKFKLKQGTGAPGGSEFQVADQPFRVTVAVRGF